MLILTRKEGEGIRIGDHIRIVLVQLKGNQARIGIECPNDLRVLREELWEAIRRANIEAMAADPRQVEDLAKQAHFPKRPPSKDPPRSSES
ncbi:MAG: carbon storage regulator [Nitrospirae bacterium]|nr:MAG: carbon storage regulator [Nitrospirota bacterium]